MKMYKGDKTQGLQGMILLVELFANVLRPSSECVGY